MADYHPYVFDSTERIFVGRFDEIYQAEREKGFDSWRQDDLRHLDLRICLDILGQYNFAKILDVGCGKGYEKDGNGLKPVLRQDLQD